MIPHKDTVIAISARVVAMDDRQCEALGRTPLHRRGYDQLEFKRHSFAHCTTYLFSWTIGD